MPLARQSGARAGHASAGGARSSVYTAAAVHFDGTQSLDIASLTSTDNTAFSMVGWVRLAAGDFADSFNTWTADPSNLFGPSFVFNASGSMALNVNDSTGNNLNDVTTNGSPDFPVDTWFCVMISLLTTATFRAKIYIGDTDYTGSTGGGGSRPYNIASNGKQLVFGDDSFGSLISGDYADWRIMPGVSLLNGSFDIPLATRRLFIDAAGKPVDPATATASLGAGAVLFSGDYDDFPINRGTGGVFTLTGTLTNAATSPSD